MTPELITNIIIAVLTAIIVSIIGQFIKWPIELKKIKREEKKNIINDYWTNVIHYNNKLNGDFN